MISVHPSFLSRPISYDAITENLAQAVGKGAIDGATVQRVLNLVNPVDDAGTRGSYAGWITRHALNAAAQRADERAMESLLMYFQRGGSIRELEAKAARLLPLFPATEKEVSFTEALWARINPLWGWRRHRRSMLKASEDPLRPLKIAELGDRCLRLTAGEARPKLGSRQRAAYLRDGDVKFLAERIVQEAPDLIGEKEARGRHEKALNAISPFLPSVGEYGARLWPPQVRAALSVLPDDRSAAVARRTQKEYSLFMSRGGEFERRVTERRQKEGHQRFTDPATQNAVYFPKSEHGPTSLIVRSHPIDTPRNLNPAGVFFEVLATIVHEDDHHVRMEQRGYSGTAEEKFAFEFHGHGVEFLWRVRHGDPSYLQSLTVEHPLGFGLAFRDYYEGHYD